MAKKETCVQKIVRLTANKFPSFGGGKTAVGNPISHILKDGPPEFAAGVNIEQVVLFVLAKKNAIDSARRKKNAPGNDARDYANIAVFLKPLSNKALREIGLLTQTDLHCCLNDATYPFRRLSEKTRKMLYHLPVSWVRGAAEWQLDSRKHASLRSRQTSAD